MTSASDIRAAALSALQTVAAQTGRTVVNVGEDDLLNGTLGLDSLDLAQVVVSLEQRLGVDPFRTPGKPLRTFGDLVAAFTAATAQET